jgi:uncharacterized radical SAM protein YgiQ
MYDIIIITADEHYDHPLCGTAMLKHVLEDKGYSVGIISKPDWKRNDDFTRLGRPRLFFGITSGAIDSMLNNYTPLKKKRAEDKHAYWNPMPDRAVIVYCNKIRELFRDSMIVIGGVEASLRRFSHYDYWENRIRKSILLDTRADILVYGSGIKQILEIAERADAAAGKTEKPDIYNISGSCILAKELPKGAKILPDFADVSGNDEKSKREFCRMQLMFSNNDVLAQKYDKSYVAQFPCPDYSTEDLDYYYSFDYKRDMPDDAQLKNMQFSVTTHWGCIGRCNFCSIYFMQGDRIVSRSKKSILDEVKRIAKHRDFKGVIDNLGGPSANMYGMDCNECDTASCMKCGKLDRSHKKLIELMHDIRKIKGVKKVYVQSGIRYDLAVESPYYIRELLSYHTREYLMIAPEHFSDKVCLLMNKKNDRFDEFRKIFDSIGSGKKLEYYFMVGHPGCTIEENIILKQKIKMLKSREFTQIFTPTPMTVSTCMYWTGINPHTMEKIYVPYSYNEKKKQKNMIVG